eukprot:5763134-Alexandrium_andersonii.AAC.1
MCAARLLAPRRKLKCSSHPSPANPNAHPAPRAAPEGLQRRVHSGSSRFEQVRAGSSRFEQ